jgi:hypothetical protein
MILQHFQKARSSHGSLDYRLHAFCFVSIAVLLPDSHTDYSELSECSAGAHEREPAGPIQPCSSQVVDHINSDKH